MFIKHTDDQTPWKQRFRAPNIKLTQLASAYPQRGLVVSNKTGRYQIYAWDIDRGSLRQLTERPAGILYGQISADGRWVYYLEDQDGDETGHYVRIPYTGGTPQDMTPGLPPYSSWNFDLSRTGHRIGFTAANAGSFQTYILDSQSGETPSPPRCLFHSQKLLIGPILSHRGEIAVISTTERSAMQHYNLLAYDTESGELIAELWDGEGTSLEAIMFSPCPDDVCLLATSNQSGFKRPLLWNLRTDERVDLSLPGLSGDVLPVDWTSDAGRILLCQFSQAIQQLYIYDLPTHSLARLDHPTGTFALDGTYFGPGDEIFAQWQDSTHPSQLIALDKPSGVKTRTVLVAGKVPSSRPWKSITFTSSDGQAIQGWLGLPEGEGPFPAILHTHGGPESVMTEVFDPPSQSWIDHGFAYLTINYRGSITFGREFQEKIWGNPGHWEVEDLAAAHFWLVNEGIAHPQQIFLTGRSYGGYNTLMALGKRPELWAGGMAGGAIADWARMYADSAATMQGYIVAFFGGAPQNKSGQYALSSPITYAENLQAPVFIFQGRSDTRTPAYQVEMYEAKLKALGKPVEVFWFDSGHLCTNDEDHIQNQARMLDFASKVLG